MTVRPAQMMHPVTQMIQPMLKRGLPSQQTEENKMCEDVLAFSKRKKQQPQNILFFFGEALAVLHGCFSAECGMRDAVCYCSHPLAPIGHAAVQSILTQLPCTQHLIHAVGPSAGRKREGEKQGERLSGRWS